MNPVVEAFGADDVDVRDAVDLPFGAVLFKLQRLQRFRSWRQRAMPQFQSVTLFNTDNVDNDQDGVVADTPIFYRLIVDVNKDGELVAKPTTVLRRRMIWTSWVTPPTATSLP